jgi:PadR family transcriptional regulator PadR
MTDRITFEDVLDELMLEEPKPDYQALVRWQERYPKYRKELADFFATWGVQEHHARFAPQTPIDEEKLVKKGVEHAMEILRRQGRIIEKAEAEAPLEPFDQLVLTAIYLLFGDAYVVNVSERASQMLGQEVLLASTFASLDRLEERYLIFGREADPKTEPDGKTRRYFTVTIAGERALAAAKATSPAVAKALEGFV